MCPFHLPAILHFANNFEGFDDICCLDANLALGESTRGALGALYNQITS
jgi:hypothetical protein